MFDVTAGILLADARFFFLLVTTMRFELEADEAVDEVGLVMRPPTSIASMIF